MMPETKETFTEVTLGQPADVRRIKKIILNPTGDFVDVEYEYGFGDPFTPCEPPVLENFRYHISDLSMGDQSTVSSCIATLHTRATTDNAPRKS